MAFSFKTFQFDCRADMPTRYDRDMRCRACCTKTEDETDPKVSHTRKGIVRARST